MLKPYLFTYQFVHSTGLTPSPTSLSTASKKSKSKSKSKDSSGLGVGDCDCDGGMVELRLIYSGADTVDIAFADKNGNTMCTVEDVEQGQEATCNIQTDYLDSNDDPVLEKLTTDTYVTLTNSDDDSDNCVTAIHTSCSRDIVGTNGDGGCGDTIIVSGWKDGSDDTNDCDDGLQSCSCTNGTYIVVPPIEEPVTEYSFDQCYCSNNNATSGITSLDDLRNYLSTTATPLADDTTTSSKKSKSKSKSRSNDGGSLGLGDCDCKDGINLLRMVNIAGEAADVITVYYDGVGSDVLCERTDVAAGAEIECDIDESGLGYEKFDKDTYVVMELESGDTCTGSWHTSCSRDIIGYAAEGCPSIIVTGWQDNAGGDECDDGFEPCPCEDASDLIDCESLGMNCESEVANGYCCTNLDGFCEQCYYSNANMINVIKAIISVTLLFALIF